MPHAENVDGDGGITHARDAQLARDGHGVQRAAAAVGDQRVVARVEAALGR